MKKQFGTKLRKYYNNEIDYVIENKSKKTKRVGNAKYLNLPLFFDLRKIYKDAIGEVLNQGDCQSCWAYATCQALSDRIRIKNLGLNKKIIHGNDGIVKDFLSPYYLVTCNSCNINLQIPNNFKKEGYTEYDFCDMGCHGGFIPHAHLYLKIHGTIPFSISQNIDYKLCPIKNTRQYLVKAKDFAKINIHNNPKTQKEHRENEIAIQQEIMEYGPVVAGYIVYQNNLDGYNEDGSPCFTSDGLYFMESGANLGDGRGEGVDGHAITIIGWGEKTIDSFSHEIPKKTENYLRKKYGNKIKYWIIRNSYGKDDWCGIDGYFMMPRGYNFCEIENDVYASYI
jgi:hypothetical protein